MKSVIHLNLRVDQTQYIPQIRQVPGYDYIHLVRQPKYMIDMDILNKKVHYLNEIFDPNEFVKKWNASLLHAHHTQLGMLLLPFKQKTGLPLVTSVRGRDATLADQPVGFVEGMKKLIEEGDLFLPVCQYLADRMVDWGCPSEKIKVLYGGVDLDQFQYKVPSISGNSKNILSMGRLVEKKGHHILMRAFSKIKPTFPDATLTIIGGGILEDELRSLARELRLGESFQLLNKVPKAIVQEKMQQADLFVAASMTASNGDVEGIPNTVKEAMASGLPVVTTTHAGIPELVTHHQNGILVNENDEHELADALEYMFLNRQLWEGFAQQAREKVEQDFDLTKQLEEQAKIYDELLGGLQWAKRKVTMNLPTYKKFE